MQSNLLATMRACLLTLSAPLAVFVVSMSSAHANITFKFEGELTSVDNALSGTFSTGDKFTGTYTFDETRFDPHDETVYVEEFKNSISAMSFTTNNYIATATNGDIDQEFELFFQYSISISPLSGDSVGEYAPKNMFVHWTDNGTQEDFRPIALPQYNPDLVPWLWDLSFGDEPLDYFDADGNLVYSGEDGLLGDPNQPLFYEGGRLVPPNGGFRLEFSDGQSDALIFGNLSSVTVVPIPTAVWLFGSGLLGLMGVAKRKQIS